MMQCPKQLETDRYLLKDRVAFLVGVAYILEESECELYSLQRDVARDPLTWSTGRSCSGPQAHVFLASFFSSASLWIFLWHVVHIRVCLRWISCLIGNQG